MEQNVYRLMAEVINNQIYMTLICYLKDHEYGESLESVQAAFGTVDYGKTRTALYEMEDIGLLCRGGHNKLMVTKFGRLVFEEFVHMGNHRSDSRGG